MITVYRLWNGEVRADPLATVGRLPEGAMWIDVLAPDAAEKAMLKGATGVEVPTLEAVGQVEPSRCLYQHNHALFMTTTTFLPAVAMEVRTAPVTFILTSDVLITVCHCAERPFEDFHGRLQDEPILIASPQMAMLGILETFVGRLADELELVDNNVDALVTAVFEEPGGALPMLAYERDMAAIGRNAYRCSKVDECLVSLSRLINFLDTHLLGEARAERAQTKSLLRDIQAMQGYAQRLSDRLQLMNDALLGRINVRQNAIIKIFSVIAVVFLPPTLVASIYGMNFEFMPELAWPFGYPMALLIMLASAILPYCWFRYRGWL